MNCSISIDGVTYEHGEQRRLGEEKLWGKYWGFVENLGSESEDCVEPSEINVKYYSYSLLHFFLNESWHRFHYLNPVSNYMKVRTVTRCLQQLLHIQFRHFALKFEN